MIGISFIVISGVLNAKIARYRICITIDEEEDKFTKRPGV